MKSPRHEDSADPARTPRAGRRTLVALVGVVGFAVARPATALQSGTAPPAAHHGAHEAAPPAEIALEVIDDPENETLTIALGPIDLPAGITHHELDQLAIQEGTYPFDFTIRGYHVEAVDGDGNPVPQTVIHHLNLLDPGRRELFLPIMLRVLAASHETPPVRVPGWLFGIPMRGGAPFLALTMLHNPTERTYRGVRIRLVLEYERSETLPLYPLVPWHIDTMFPTGSKAFDLPPGASRKSYAASPAVRGLIVGLGGHLHQHATALRLEDVTTGEVLYDAEIEVDEDGHLREIPVMLHRGRGLGLLIEPEHVYRVTAEYFNPTGETIPGGGMGSVGGAFIPLEAWPASNPFDPLYEADYEWVLESLSHEAMNMEHDHTEMSKPPRR